MARPTRVVVIDCETTGLDPSRHRIVEIAWRVFDVGKPLTYYDHHSVWVSIEDWGLADADAEVLTALDINQAVKRYDADRVTGGRCLAVDLNELLDGALIVGLNPQFDMGMIAAHCQRHEQPVPSWHYWALDVKALAQSDTNRDSDPLSSESLMRRHGIDPDRPGRHTAMGDVKMTVDLAVAVFEERGGSWVEWVEAAINPVLPEPKTS